MATITVLSDISTAPIAVLSRMPELNKLVNEELFARLNKNQFSSDVRRSGRLGGFQFAQQPGVRTGAHGFLDGADLLFRSTLTR